MNHRSLWLLFLTGTAWATTGPAQDMRGCRGLADAPARLACYDALPLPPPVSQPVSQPSMAAGGLPSRPAPALAVVSPVAPATPAPALAQPAAGEASFGLQGLARGEVAAVRSTVAGRFEGWGPRSRIRLANGQLWEVADDNAVATWLLDPKVVVRRAALGSFLMEVEGLNRTARVRRVE